MGDEQPDWLPREGCSPLAAALEYAAHDLPVFPLHSVVNGVCSCPKGASCGNNAGKHPRTRHGVKDATTDPALIRRWWAQWPTANVGIATGGPSRIVVLDVDGDAGRASLLKFTLPPTMAQRTGSGGLHLVFTAPPDAKLRNAVKFRPGLDTRTDGGYIVAAPSTHVSGQRYTWENRADPADLPPELHAAMTAPRTRLARVGAEARVTYREATGTDGGSRPTVDSAQGGRRYTDAALSKAVAAVRAAPPGERNSTLNREAYGMAGLVASGALDSNAAWSALLDAGAAAGLSEGEMVPTLRSAFTAGEAKPRAIPERLPRYAPPRSGPAPARGDTREQIDPDTGEVHTMTAHDGAAPAMVSDGWDDAPVNDAQPTLPHSLTPEECRTILDAIRNDPERSPAPAFDAHALDGAAALREGDLAGFETFRAKLRALPGKPVNLNTWDAAVRDAVKARRPTRAPAPPLIHEGASITIGPDERRVNTEAVEVLARHPDVYQRGSILVQVVRDLAPGAGVVRPAKPATIAPMGQETLRELLSEVLTWVQPKMVQGAPVKEIVHVPAWAVSGIHARAQWEHVRTLDGVTECPVFLDSGEILTEPGYHPPSALLYIPSGPFPAVPDHPTHADATAARDVLLDLVSDFPFKTDAHRAAWVAAVLTLVARRDPRDKAPLYLVDANTRGSGKGKLCDLAGIIAAGRPMSKVPNTEHDEEQRKQITARAIAGDTMVLIDNIKGTLGTPSLDMALTNVGDWEDRILGVSQMVRIQFNPAWFATGNNVSLAGDMGRRVLHIRLESPEDNPERRADFKHPDILSHARDNRGQYLAAALTILRAWHVAGRPRHTPSLSPWGSFERWSAVIREAVVWVGMPDPFLTCDALQAESDTSAGALVMLLDGWADVCKRFAGEATAVQVLDELARNTRNAARGDEPLRYLALREALAELCATRAGELPSVRQLGTMLRHHRGRACQGRALGRATDYGRSGAVWSVRPVTAGGALPSTDPEAPTGDPAPADAVDVDDVTFGF